MGSWRPSSWAALRTSFSRTTVKKRRPRLSSFFERTQRLMVMRLRPRSFAASRWVTKSPRSTRRSYSKGGRCLGRCALQQNGTARAESVRKMGGVPLESSVHRAFTTRLLTPADHGGILRSQSVTSSSPSLDG